MGIVVAGYALAIVVRLSTAIAVIVRDRQEGRDMAEPDWSDLRAEKWLATHYSGRGYDADDRARLAVLLRDVAKGSSCQDCREYKAEMRRVVATVRDHFDRAPNAPIPAPPDDVTRTCDEILKRLEDL